MRKRFWEVFSKGRTVNSVARYARKRLLLMRVVCAVLQRGAWSLRQVVDEVEVGGLRWVFTGVAYNSSSCLLSGVLRRGT